MIPTLTAVVLFLTVGGVASAIALLDRLRPRGRHRA